MVARARFLPLLLLATAAAAAAGADADVPDQLSKTKQCRSDGFRDTLPYRSFVAVPGTPHFLPAYASFDLTKAPQVSSVVIIVHGIAGNANTFFCDALKAVPASVGVVAPWYGSEAVRLQSWAAGSGSAAAAEAAGGDHTSLHWRGGKWLSGAGAANAGGVASFAALDAVVAAVARAHAAAPAGQSKLKQIVIVGFSAGAQMVQRYAWATHHGPGSAVPVKFVVSDPSTFMYFDERRPEESCRPLRDTGADWSCAKFSRPPSAASSCPDYDTYRLGLRDLAAGSPYFSQARFAGSAATAALSAAYLRKSILYVLGSADACNCNTKGYANPASCIRPAGEAACSPSLAGPTCCDMPAPKRHNFFIDVSCGEMMQGSNRLQRGLLFASYLRVFSNGQHVPQVVVVPGMAHDQAPMLSSAAFQSFVSA